MRPSRRQLLQGLAATALVAPAGAWGFGDSSRFVPAVAQHGGNWRGRITALRRLAWELQRRTSVEVVLDARPLPLDSPELFKHPFLYLGSDGPLPAFSNPEVENLRRYLTFGGLLVADANDGSDGPLPAFSNPEVENLRRYLTFGGLLVADANDGSDGNGFDPSFRREMERVLPNAPLGDLSADHVVFKSFYLLDAAPGRLLNRPQLQAAYAGKRAAVLYSQNDVAGAWSRAEGGSWEYECSPGGEPQRELALRLGVNLAMYGLCLDYKDDAVHLPMILKKRR